MEYLFQTQYRAATVYPRAALHADRRVFHKRQAVIRAAFEPHHAFPEKRLGV